MGSPKRRFSLSRTVAVLGMLLLFGGAIVSGGGTGFIDLPSLLPTFGFTFFLLLGSFGVDFLKFIPDAIITLFMTPSTPLPRYAEIARFGSRYAVASAVIVTLLNFIQMLQNLDDPGMIGAGISITLLPILYALFLSEVIFALLYKVYADGEVPKD